MLIKHIPNIFEKEGRAEYPDVEWIANKTVAYYCRRTIGRTKGYKAIVNGGVVGWDFQPLKTDEIIFTPDVKDSGSIISGVIGTTLFVVGAFTGQPWLMAVGGSMVLGAVVSGVAGIFAPEVSSGDNFADSKAYSWNGIQNIYGEGSYLPVVLGRHRQGGAILERYVETSRRTETIYTDHHISLYGGYSYTHTTSEEVTEVKEELSLLIGLSEGPVLDVHSNSVHFNRQPISLFDSGTIEGPYTRSGFQSQSPVSGFSSTRHYFGMTSPVELIHNSPYIYRVNNPEAESVRLHFTFPALTRINSKGRLRHRTVDFVIQHSTSDSGPWTTVRNFTAGARTMSEYNLDRQITLPNPGGYVQIIRLSENDIDDPKRMTDSYLRAVSEIEPATVAYVNTALIAMKVAASELVSGQMPVVSTLVDGVRIPDVRTGVTNLGSIRNPANIVWEILKNKRWGAGRYITEDQIDIASLQEFANWCDEGVTHVKKRVRGFGGYRSILVFDYSEARYQVGFVIDKEFRVLELIEKICSSCRAIPCWSGNKLKIVIDRPQAGYAQTFTMGNIIEGSFEETFSDVKVPTQIEAEYLDEDDDFKKKIITAIDKSRINEQPIIKRINMFGLTSRSRVKREVAFIMRKLKAYENEIRFKASIDGVICEVGSLIRIQHNIPQYGYGGRVLSVNGSTVTLDQPVPFQAGTNHTLRVRRQDDNTYYVNNELTSGTDTTLQAIDLGEVHNVKVDDVWTFGPNGLDFRPYRVLSITKASDQEVSIAAENYNPSIHNDDNGIVVYDNKYSLLGLTTSYNIDGSELTPIPEFDHDEESVSALIIPPYVTGVKLFESKELIGNAWKLSISVSFTPVELPPNAGVYIREYRVLYSTDGVNWQNAGEVAGHNANIQDAELGQIYYVLVKPYTNMGVTNNIEKSIYRLSNAITLEGDQVPPMPPSDLTVTAGNFCNHLRWINPEDTEDLSGIEIWASAGQNNREAAILVRTTLSEGWTHYDLNHALDYYYWIRGIDSSGNVGPFYPIDPLAGVQCSPMTDPAILLDRLTGSISIEELTGSLTDRINIIDHPSTGLVVKTNALQAEIAVMQAELNDIQNLPVFDANSDWLIDDVVKYEGALYRALQDMTAPSPLPTNTAYWEKVGDYSSLADAVVAHSGILEDHGSRITSTENGVSANAQSITGLTSRMTNAEGSITNHSTAISGLQTTVSNQGGQLTSVASDVTSLQTGLTNAQTNISSNSTAISGLSTRVTAAEGNITSISTDITELSSNLDAVAGNASSNSTAISGLQTTVSSQGGQISSLSTRTDNLESTVNNPNTGVNANAGAVTSLDTRVTAAEGSITTNASDITSLQGSVNTLNNDLNATSAAVSSLQIEVTGHGNQITSISQDLTNLSSTVNHPSTGLATKASTTALTQAISTEQDARATAINSLSAKVHGASLVNSLMVAGVGDGWQFATAPAPFDIDGRTGVGVTETRTASAQRRSDWFVIDPTSIYEVRISLHSDGGGRNYFGLYTNPTAIGAREYTPATGVIGGVTTNPYWFTPSAFTGWRDIVCYLAGSSADLSLIPENVKGANHGAYIVEPGAEGVQIRGLSGYSLTAESHTTTWTAASVRNISQGVSAGVKQTATALATLDGQVKAEYSVMINANNRVTGFKNMITGAGESSFDILADKFRIVNQDDNGEVKAPFVVSDNQVGINGELIVNGSITASGLRITGAGAITADTIPESSTRKYAAESGADKTSSNTAYDTARVSGTTASTVVARANAGNSHAGTAHAPSNADRTETVVGLGFITTGRIEVRQGTGSISAGITGAGSGDSNVRFWAGQTFANRGSAPFRVLQNGTVYASNLHLGSGSTIDSSSTISGTAASTVVARANAGNTHAGQKGETHDYYLGSAASDQDYLILLCRSDDSGTQNHIAGTLYGRRVSGHTATCKIDIIFNNSTDGTRPSGMFEAMAVEDSSVSLVTCNYGGHQYFALRHYPISIYQRWSHGIWFAGQAESSGEKLLPLNTSATSNVLPFVSVNPVSKNEDFADYIPETAARKWAGESGADKTSSNTAYDTARVSGTAASTVVARANAGNTHSGTAHAPSNADNTLGVFTSNPSIITAGVIKNHVTNPNLEINFNTATITVNSEDGLIISSSGGMDVSGDINLNYSANIILRDFNNTLVGGIYSTWGQMHVGGYDNTAISGNEHLGLYSDNLRFYTPGIQWHPTVGAKGTYVFGHVNATVTNGSIYSGSHIYPGSIRGGWSGNDGSSSVHHTAGPVALNGSWMCMGRNQVGNATTTLFYRIV